MIVDLEQSQVSEEVSTLFSTRSHFVAELLPIMTVSKRKNLYLFGYPIAHSGAPSLHNLVFESIASPSTFGLWSTSRVDDKMLAELRSETNGGAA